MTHQRPSEIPPWFATSVQYSGDGRAEWPDGQGVAEGPVTVQYDETGDIHIEMEVARFTPEANMYRVIGIMMSTCTSLTVVTPEGEEFVTQGAVMYSPHYDLSTSQPQIKLQFLPSRAQFVRAPSNLAVYWVLPLTNFLTNLLPDMAGPGHLLQLTTTNRRLIPFAIPAGEGFIELLPEYQARKQRLEAHQERRLVTAMMVGKIGDVQILDQTVDQWFPEDFLLLLGLATGADVGAPWIELRDEQGRLVNRIHCPLRRPIFHKVRGTIEHGSHDGIGTLLNSAASAEAFDTAWLRAVLNNLVLCWQNPHIEGILGELIRALDALCTQFGYKTQRLLPQLDAEQQRRVKEILSNASEKLLKLSREAGKAGQVMQRQTLHKIAGRVASNPANIDKDFGLAVSQLLDHFQLFDAKIVELHYLEHPRADGNTWAQMLSDYRGAVMHQNYLDFDQGHDLEEVIRVTRHLHDILVRLVFKLLGYSGTYQPSVAKYAAKETVDWVTQDLPIEKLGYGSEAQPAGA
jgi:hypothetical protein